MLLAEVLHSPNGFHRLETFHTQGEARTWIEHVIKTDPSVQCYRHHCFIRISDIPTRDVLVESIYASWR